MVRTPRKYDISTDNGSSHSTTNETAKTTEKNQEKINAVMGLDISSAVVGICILEERTPNKLILLDHIKLTSSKLKDEYDKTDTVEKHFEQLMTSLNQYSINKIFIEDAAKRFSPGFSSANTISTLCRFNGIVSYIVYKLFDVKPVMINVRSARARLGIKINQADKTKTTKEKVFEVVRAMNPHFQWNTHIAKTGKSKGKTVYDKENEDRCDAWVICKGGPLV